MKTLKQIEAIGFRDGREAAIEQRATEPLTASTGADEWDAGLLNALGAKEVARLFGLTRIYDGNRGLTRWAEKALAAYTRGRNNGWNKNLLHAAEVRSHP